MASSILARGPEPILPVARTGNQNVFPLQHNLPPNTQEDDDENEISDCESDVSDSEDTTAVPTPRQLEAGTPSSSMGSSPTSTRCPSPSKTPSDRIKVEVTAEPEDDDPCLTYGLDPSPLPPKKGTRFYRYFRWNFGSVYRRIFCLAFLGNLAALCVLTAKNFAINQKFTYVQASTAVTANILAAILVRNEHIVNAMFWVFGTWSARMPLGIRTLVAKIYSYGGIHSGCAVAGTGWYIIFLILMTFDFAGKELTALRGYIYFFCYLIVALLISMLITAHPHLRRTMHNWFEGVHRFMGWLAVLLFWAQVMLLTAEQTTGTPQSFGKALLVNPNFWMLVVITGLIIYPWTRLRMREVEAEVLSPHCVKLNFTYRDVYYGQAVRLTDAPLKETHAFGVIPHPFGPSQKSLSDSSDSNSVSSSDKTPVSPLSHAGEKGYSVIVSNAGDWTKKIINNPPKKIYTRGTPQFGVMRVAGLFEPCIVVATGSGIAPCLSLFVQRPNHPVRIIWSTKKPLETYGQGIIDLLYQTDPRAIIIDTNKGGPKCRRPDLVKIAYRVWEQSAGEGPGDYEGLRREGKENTTGRKKKAGKCEAVVIISNQRLTEKVVYGLESRGVPAYGALFDS
ncbi:putative NRPS-like enzyme [Podospora fimiseda]|uniref:NRPS-like enzyme n=1 Tax=Podospora fimiseda TaxID=252190 RepID=A0AAN7BJM5_9PEZI|nr:putative NRPS-like enzyme [Podospora fimiseda]